MSMRNSITRYPLYFLILLASFAGVARSDALHACALVLDDGDIRIAF